MNAADAGDRTVHLRSLLPRGIKPLPSPTRDNERMTAPASPSPQKPDPAAQEAAAHTRGASAALDGDETLHYRAKMPKAPAWLHAMLASNKRESRRFRDELVRIKGAWPLLMKERRGGKWTDEDKARLKEMVRSASAVSPYLFVWAIPGSMALLPFLAWCLDRQRIRARKRAAARPPE